MFLSISSGWYYRVHHAIHLQKTMTARTYTSTMRSIYLVSEYEFIVYIVNLAKVIFVSE